MGHETSDTFAKTVGGLACINHFKNPTTMKLKHLPLTLSIAMFSAANISISPTLAQTPKGACSGLMVSEGKFGKEVDSAGNITAINHSVELFNTTDTDIDLSLYTLELVPDNGTPTVMGLSGIIPTHGTYVLTNVNSSQGIIALADAVELLLLFDGKVSIELKKGNTVKDKIGKENVSDIAIGIDLNALIADPIGYLQNAEIDLGSIENLTIKRKPIVQRGKSSFDTQSFINEWNAYPESFSQGLGAHTNACVAAVVQWQLSEITVNENAADVTVNISISGNQPDFVDGNFWDIPPSGQTSWAIDGQDFTEGSNGFFQFPPFSNQLIPIVAANIIDDNQPELTEWFALDIFSVNGATIGTNNVLLFKIIDNDGLSIQDIEVAEQITVFPSVFSRSFSVFTEATDVKIETITLVDMTGRSILLSNRTGNSTEMRVEVGELAAGYLTAIIRTNQGIAVKKILKTSTAQ